jgi:PEP-CTERM motif
MKIALRRGWVAVAVTMMALSSMAYEASAAIISDQTQLVTDKGTVELIVNQVDSNTYQATLIWSPTGYTGGASDYISNVAIKLTSDTSDESLLVDPNGTWNLEVDAASNFGAADGCGGNDQGSICAKTTDETNTTNASRTWEFQFDTSSLFTEDLFHVQVQFHNANDSPAGQISTLFDGDRPPHYVPAPATLSLLGVGLVGLGFARRRRTN